MLGQLMTIGTLVGLAVLSKKNETTGENDIRLSVPKYVEVVSVKTEHAGDILVAKVMIKNKKSKTVNLQYSFSWLDEDNDEIEKESWTPLFLKAGRGERVQGVAPDSTVVDFNLIITNLD